MPEPPTRPRPAPTRPATPAHGWRPFVRPLAIVLGVSFAVVLGVLALRRFPIQRSAADQPRPAHLTINARPENLEVLIDGESRGTTPVTLSLAPGAHTVIVRSGSDERVVPLTLAAGADVTHYFEMKPLEPATTSAACPSSPIHPARACRRRQGPGCITDYDRRSHCNHPQDFRDQWRGLRRAIGASAGWRNRLGHVLPAQGCRPGRRLAGDCLAVRRRGGRAGRHHRHQRRQQGHARCRQHDLELSNKRLGFHSTRAVEITAGKTLTLKVDAPNAAVNVNARPWADVTVDGNSIGQTPIASILMAVGTHELTFKHPQFGERRQTIVVTANGPNRIAVDLTK